MLVVTLMSVLEMVKLGVLAVIQVSDDARVQLHRRVAPQALRDAVRTLVHHEEMQQDP
jgi:hypothetical protein